MATLHATDRLARSADPDIRRGNEGIPDLPAPTSPRLALPPMPFVGPPILRPSYYTLSLEPR